MSSTAEGTVHYERFPVSDHLRHWICGFFRWSGPPPERILPNGQIDLLFAINDQPIDPNGVRVERHVRTLLYGELRQPLTGLGRGNVDVFGVALFPWAAEFLAGMCARDLDGSILPLNKIGAVDSEPVRAMLTECPNDLQRIRLMEDLFSRTLPRSSEVEETLYLHWVEVWSRGGGDVSGEERTQAGRSTFEKMFHRKAGMTLRQFSRLARFHAFLNRLESGEKISTLARDTGYYDQAHLTRECRDFSGVPPRELHVQLASGTSVLKRETAPAHFAV